MFLTVHIDPEQQLTQCVGIRGIVLKESDPELIVEAMDAVLAGGKWFARGVTEPALQLYLENPTGTVRSDDLLTARIGNSRPCLQRLRNRQIADHCLLTKGLQSPSQQRVPKLDCPPAPN